MICRDYTTTLRCVKCELLCHLIARPIQRLDLLLGQLPAERARVLSRLLGVLRAGDVHGPFADTPVQRHLRVRLAAVILSDLGHEFEQGLEF